jgi:phosphate transport system protein
LGALIKSDRTVAEPVRCLEEKIDACHNEIYERCLSLMTLQAPVAGDARLITGVLGSIVDLKAIGDYADEIAQFVLAMQSRPVSAALNELAEVEKKVEDLLARALENWRNLDRTVGLSIRPMQTVVKDDCQRLIEKFTTMTVSSRDNSPYVGMILVCKYLERIAVHSVNVGEQAAFAAPSYT